VGEWLSKTWLRLSTLFQRRQLDRDLEDELAFHLAMREGKNREAGLDATEARYAARRRLGNLSATRERSREMWTFDWLESLAQDVRYAARGLWKSPGFTTVVVLTLALGVGACSSIFSVVNPVLLRQLSYRNADRLVLLWGTGGRAVNREQISFTDLQDWRKNSHSFAEMANFHTYVYTLTESDQSERVRGAADQRQLFPRYAERAAAGPLFCG